MIKEVAKIAVEGMSTAQFRHGPLELAEPQMLWLSSKARRILRIFIAGWLLNSPAMVPARLDRPRSARRRAGAPHANRRGPCLHVVDVVRL